MIRNLLIITVVSFLAAAVCLAGAAALGVGDAAKGFHRSSHWDFSWDEDKEDGDAGPRSTRDFAWTGNDKLVVNLPGKVRYIQGPTAKVTVTASQAILDRVKIDNGEIGLSDGHFRASDSRIEIVVQAPAVKSFHFNGGNKVQIEGYAQDMIAIEANGALDLDASGAARSLDLHMNGAGKADLDDLALEKATVELNGAGKASLAPRQSVDIRIHGVGHVELKRRPPSINKEIHGVGSVTILEDAEDDHDSNPATPPAPSAPSKTKSVGTTT